MRASSPSAYVLCCALSALGLGACSGDDDPAGTGGGTTSTGTGAGGTGGSGAGGGAGGSGASGQGGGVISGDSVTVQGSDFGTKAQPAPLLFDEFEGGSVGTQIQQQEAVIGQWQTGAGSDSPVYSDEVVRVGAQSCLNPFTQSVYNSSLALNVDLTTVYLDYWVHVAPLDATIPDGLTRNWKPFRLYGNADNLQSGVTFFGNIGQIVYGMDLQGGLDHTDWFGSGLYPPEEWFHIQYWLRLNDLGQANGSVRALVRGEPGGADDLQLRGSSMPMNQIRIGHYWATDPVDGWEYENPGANVYVDTVYIDDTWARVEVGDAAEYHSCTHREIQLVTAWSDEEVTFTFSRGTLPAGALYAFVIDHNDELRATEPLVAH